jgi:hypothetical protein
MNLINNKKGAIPYIVVLITVVAGLFTIMSFFGIGWDIASITGEGIYVTESGRLECLEDQSPEQIIKWGDQGYTFECGGDYLIDGCTAKLECSGTPWYAPNCRIPYTLNGQNSEVFVREGERDTFYLNAGDNIKFYSSATYTNEKYLKITYEFNPYRLYTFEAGKKEISSSSDCCLANQNALQKNQFKYGDWVCLEKSGSNQYKNYFLYWNLVYGAKIYPYQGNEVICLDNTLYELEREKLADGSTKNIQGNAIKNVECCPHQSSQCSSSTFEFLQADEGEDRTCAYDYQCENSGDPWTISRTKALYEDCVGGVCVEKTLAIECDSDAQCRSLYGDNYGCDLSYDNFGKCILIGQIEQPRCGDLICQTGETKDNCPSDCEIVCPEGWKLVSIERKTNCFIGFPLYWGCDTEVTKECQEGGYNWLKIILTIFIIIVLLFVIIRYIIPYVLPLIRRVF